MTRTLAPAALVFCACVVAPPPDFKPSSECLSQHGGVCDLGTEEPLTALQEALGQPCDIRFYKSVFVPTSRAYSSVFKYYANVFVDADMAVKDFTWVSCDHPEMANVVFYFYVNAEEVVGSEWRFIAPNL